MSIQILMPALSPTMEEGKLAKWLVKEGDAVKSGDILAEIETDKATMEFEAVDEGRIGKILVPAGTEGVKVNAPIAVLLGEGETRRRGRYSRRNAIDQRGGDGGSETSGCSAKPVTAPAQKPRSPLEGEPSSRSELGGGSARSAAPPHPEAAQGRFDFGRQKLHRSFCIRPQPSRGG